MVRNLILLVASTGALLGLFLAYQRFATIEAPPTDERPSAFQRIDAGRPADDERIVFENQDRTVQIDPSDRRTEFTIFDEVTGRPTQSIRVDKWRKVAGTRNEVEVEGLELTLHRKGGLLAGGMQIDVTAARGRFVGEGFDKNQPRPKSGRLQGGTKVVVRAAGGAAGGVSATSGPAVVTPGTPGTPAASQPDAVRGETVTITADALDFDIERSEIQVHGPLILQNEQLVLAGRDLKLIWNQTENRVELLEMRGAGSLEWRRPLEPENAAESKPVPVAASRPAVAALDPALAPGMPEPITTYSGVLTGAIVAEQRLGDAAVGSLTADELRFLVEFDPDSGPAGRRGRARSADPAHGPATKQGFKPEPAAVERHTATAVVPAAPASQPSATSSPALPKTYVVAWRDGLIVTPRETTLVDPGRRLRRRVEARGQQVVLKDKDRSIECGGLRFNEDTRQLWLTPRPGEQIELDLGDKVSARADSIFADVLANRIKLVGDVRISDRRVRGRLSTIACSLWAELVLARPESDPAAADAGVTDPLVALEFSTGGGIESANFVGDVHIVRSDAEIRAQRVEASFSERTTETAGAPTSAPAVAAATRPADAGGSFEELGELDFEQVIASGGVTVIRDNQRVRATWLQARFASRPEGGRYISSVRALGAVNLRDNEDGVRVQGQELLADLAPGGGLLRADVLGKGTRPARVLAQGYDVRGPSIVLTAVADGGVSTPVNASSVPGSVTSAPLANATTAPTRSEDFVLEVPGPAELRFESKRGLRGLPTTGQNQMVTVTAAQRLRVDTRPAVNTVEFVGAVRAATDTETLDADVLTLHMVNAPAPPAEPPSGYGLAWRVAQLAGLRLAGGKGEPDQASLSGLLEGERRANLRREPVRVTAANALVVSDTYVPGRPEPLATQSIEAPQLLIELREGRMRSLGETVLSMINRRVEEERTPTSGTMGVPSSLTSRGPSQTWLRCSTSMDYVIGADGPDRQDKVLFEGAVRFLHLAGREMPNLADVVPALANQPDRIAALPDRATQMDCQRLEVVLDSGQRANAPGPSSAPAAGATTEPRRDRFGGLQLAWLNASGQVFLLDQAGGGLREVTAHQVQFDQRARTVLVLGNKQTNEQAVVTYENKLQQRFDRPVRGFAMTVFLDTNMVQSEGMSGEFRR